MQVRPGCKRDRKVVCRLECACFGWARLLSGLWPRTGANGAAVWIAEDSGRPVGYLISYERGLDGRQVWYVGGVGVLRSHRDRGIATQLMGVVFADHPTVWLHVRASNQAALHLYDTLGMQALRRHKSFYSNGDDAIVMVTPDLAALA